MKNILVPVDFSENANNALSFAIAIANRFGSHITLYHAYRVYSTAGMLVSVERYMKADAEVDMKELIRQSQARLKTGATIEGIAVRGDTIDSIAHKADQGGFDLIVMGTQGASGLREVFLGSTTNGVITRTRVPVLAIPNGCVYKAFRSVVLAMDSQELHAPEILDPLIFLLKAYHADLSVYHKAEGKEDEGVDPRLSQWLKEVPYTRYVDFGLKNVNESVTGYLEERGGDLLCMIRRKRGFLAGLFHRSVTSKEAFTTDVPLLVLHDDQE